MKKKKLYIVLSGLVMIALLGGTYAAFTASTSTVQKVSAKRLGIKIVQDNDTKQKGVTEIDGYADSGNVSGFSYKGNPGTVVEEQVGLENTGDIPCFVRVTINRSWVKERADGTAEKVFDNVDPREIRITSDSNWFVQEDEDPEVIYCYYKYALEPGKSAEKVMENFSILKSDDVVKSSNQYAGLAANILLEADAVQHVAAKDAMLAEWGVEAVIEGNQIVSMPQFQ